MPQKPLKMAIESKLDRAYAFSFKEPGQKRKDAHVYIMKRYAYMADKKTKRENVFGRAFIDQDGNRCMWTFLDEDEADANKAIAYSFWDGKIRNLMSKGIKEIVPKEGERNWYKSICKGELVTKTRIITKITKIDKGSIYVFKDGNIRVRIYGLDKNLKRAWITNVPEEPRRVDILSRSQKAIHRAYYDRERKRFLTP